MLSLRKPSPERIQDFRASHHKLDFTYPAVGVTDSFLPVWLSSGAAAVRRGGSLALPQVQDYELCLLKVRGKGIFGNSSLRNPSRPGWNAHKSFFAIQGPCQLHCCNFQLKARRGRVVHLCGRFGCVICDGRNNNPN